MILSHLVFGCFLPSILFILFLRTNIILTILNLIGLLVVLHVLKDLSHPDSRIPLSLSLMCVICIRLSIGVGVSHDEILLGIEPGLIYVIDMRYRPRGVP